ncbi:MAG: DNA repair protein RadC [Clostridiales bacterium]|nr:DNA repair protein RadC [Clostridiales bacterium]
MSVHSGHRKRIRERFLKDGLDNFPAHNAVEFLLFYALPQKDTNELAHRLIERFGSLAGVFDAPYEELLKVDGVGETTATLIKLIPQLSRRYMIDSMVNEYLNTTKKAGKFLLPYYIARKNETVFLVCLDSKCKVISCQMIFEGSVNSTQVNIRKIIETALKYNASGVIIAHNHPGGVALPSPEDLAITKRILEALRVVGLAFIDHIIVADNDFVSLADSGFIERISS